MNLPSLASLEEQLQSVIVKLQSPEALSHPQKTQSLNREYRRLEQVKLAVAEYRRIEKQIEETKQMQGDESDESMRNLAQEEGNALQSRLTAVEEELQRLLVPPDPQDHRDLILEIRAGAGGDEAGLFAAQLFRMYSRYAEQRKWRMHVLNSSRTGIGGFKEIIAEINGEGAFGALKFESGVHRVQRVPETEKSGRVHTSTVTVAVLPVAEEVELEIKPQDLRIDVFRSSGHGGQSVNTTDSAVRITYLPTNTVVTCQDEKSQIKNREKALKVLRSRLLAVKEENEHQTRGEARRLQIGTGDRSEKIRTYNFSQDRITDHRIKRSWSNMIAILDGELDPMLRVLASAAHDLRATSEPGD